MTLLPALGQALLSLMFTLHVTSLGDEVDGVKTRSVAQYENGGPQCRIDGATVIDGQCSYVCEAAWDKEADTNFLLCTDPMSCFNTFWDEHLRELSEVQTSLVSTLQKQCSFDDYETYTSSDLDASTFFGGDLCGDLELSVVDFIAGHPTAFEGKSRNCSLYSAAAEAKRVCEEDKKQNQRNYCELNSSNLPTVPDLSELCSVTPSQEYQYAFFYECIPPSDPPFECVVSSTSSWDTALSACKCPSGTSPCTLPEAKYSELWQDDLKASAQVYLSGSMRFLSRYGVYEAFKYSYNPCRNLSAQALCKRDMGPNCFRGNDQPFCRMPCLELWKEFQAENNPQFQRIVQSPADDVISLENTCAAYERFSLVKFVYGHREGLVEGLKISGCTEHDFTEVVNGLLPDAFYNGQTPTYSVPIDAVSRASEACPSSNVAWFVAWNCSPDTSIPGESLPIACNLYRTTGAVDDSQHSCACPNSAQPCGADAATVSGNWIKNLPAQASVSLADFLMYKTTKMGYGAIVVVDGLSSVCAEGSQSYVLCEDVPQDTASDSMPSRQPACKRAFWIGDGATAADDRSYARAPDCAVALSKDETKVSTLRCRYLCGNLEWRCRSIVSEDPNRYSDLMECFEQLVAGTPLEYCEMGATIQSPTPGAANLASSWLLASGVETEVRFASPVVPTPVVFMGASRPIDGLPKFVVSQVTSESFKVQLLGGFCGAVPASPELKLVTSYLALPPGEYLAKHSSLRLVVGRTLITSPGDAVVQVPFVISDPSKPFITISVGYLIAATSEETTAHKSALAASLGGRFLACFPPTADQPNTFTWPNVGLGATQLVVLFDSTEVTEPAITLPSNLPSLFQPHFFPQVAGRLRAADTIYSLQWQEGGDQSWTPSVWGSKCGSVENLITKVSSSDVKFTGLYIAAISSSVCNVKPAEGGTKTEEECATMCSGIYLLYCFDSTFPIDCLRDLLPADFNIACILLGEDQPVEGDSDETVVEDVPEEIPMDVKCKVFDMRDYSANLAWDSLTFTCACPGQSPACSQTAATRDLTWLKQLHEEGGLCEGANGAIKPVIQHFYQLNQDACSLAYLQDASLLPWSKRTYPAYPDFSGPGSETAADEDEDTGEVAPQGPVEPPSCFAGEWGEWSVCDATCLAADQDSQRIRRRSPLVSVDSLDNSTCVLEEKESCGGSLAPCSSYCWSAPWTEWADCAELLVADTLVNARRRYRPIFAGADFCDLNEIQEIDPCRGGRALDIDLAPASGEGFTEILSLQQSQAEVSECCLLAKGHSALKRKLRRIGDLYSGPAAAVVPLLLVVSVNECLCGFLCRLPPTSGTDAPAPCTESADLKDCHSTFDITWRTSCRPTFTRIVDPNATYSFLTNVSEDKDTADVSSSNSSPSTPSCSCLDHGLEPCTAEDIVEDWKGIRDTLLGSGGLCTTKAAQTPLWNKDGKNPIPDSSIYLGYAGFGKLHCPLRGYKKGLAGVEEYFTFTNFSSPAELNDFCEGGLDYWDDTANPLVYAPVPDCSKAAPRKPLGVEAGAEETDYCQKAKALGATYKSCFVDPFQDPAFSEACTFKLASTAGKGILLCKEVEPKCEFTPWGEWSACSVSCISSIDQIGTAFRVRSREVLEDGKRSPRCRELALFGTVEVDACPNTPLCASSGGAENAQAISFTTKAPPTIASWSPDSTPETSPPPDPDAIPFGITPQSCSITKIESCSCPTGYRPCYRGEAVLSAASWTEDAYRLCASTSNISVRARNFQEFMDASTSSNQHAALFFIGSLCLGALAALILAYLLLQYSVDLQKLVGLRGRYAEISIELEQMKEGRIMHEHDL
ncbi:hypothetical protein Emed_001891 [Eimeria media]